MIKKVNIYIGILLIALLWIFILDVNKPKPINWTPSFKGSHKIPYGSYVLRKELPKLLSNKEIKDVIIPPYELLQDSTICGNYIFINDYLNFDEVEFNELLKFVERGNNVFLSTLSIHVDTLNFKTQQIYDGGYNNDLKLKLLNPSLDTISRTFKNDISTYGFSSIDTLKTTILGKFMHVDEDGELLEERFNFAKHPYGKGHFYFHTYPFAFTNYYMLNEDYHEYISSVFSYLDNDLPIYWDSYYKSGNSRISTPMFYILNSRSLKWAYYTVLILVLLFVLFNGKRNQRAIPVITPLKNQTLAFARTIAGMYFDKSDHKSIAQHRINYFLEFIRTQLHVPTLDLNDEVFHQHVAGRSGNSQEDVEKLFRKIVFIQQQTIISKELLMELNQLIEQFKQTYKAS